MKQRSFAGIILVLLFLVPAFVTAKPPAIQDKYADSVDDVNAAYSPSDWVISPDDELQSYTKVDNAPECDIKGVISCYDPSSLRVDIILQSPISYDVKVWYAMKFEYAGDYVEYYTFYPVSGDFIYEKEENGKVTKTEDLKGDKVDFTGVTESGKIKDSDVYLIINKEKHIGGEAGQTYYLTTSFYSGYIDVNDKMQFSDITKKVNLYFKK